MSSCNKKKKEDNLQKISQRWTEIASIRWTKTSYSSKSHDDGNDGNNDDVDDADDDDDVQGALTIAKFY